MNLNTKEADWLPEANMHQDHYETYTLFSLFLGSRQHCEALRSGHGSVRAVFSFYGDFSVVWNFPELL